jgi:hypothetical protein
VSNPSDLSHPSNVEWYKKQAKDLRRSHADGDVEVAAQLKEHLPRCANLSSAEILTGELALQEAQHVVACLHGYKNWNWLCAVADGNFDLLARLEDREVQQLLRVVDRTSLVLSLFASGDSPVAAKVLGNISQRTRVEVAAEVAALKRVDPAHVEGMRRAILRQLALLATKGVVTWPEGNAAKAKTAEKEDPHLLALLARPLENMHTGELVELFAAMAAKAQQSGVVSLDALEEHVASPFLREALQLTVDATEPALVQDMLKTRSTLAAIPALRKRAIRVVEGIMAMVSNDTPRIVHYKLSTVYQAERSDTWNGPSAVHASDLVARLRSAPFAQMSFAEVDAFITDMAGLWQRERVAGLRPLLAAVDYPLLHRALEMVCADANHDELMQTLEAQMEEQLRQIELRHAMVGVGIRAVWELQSPEETAAVLRAAAV